MKKIYMKATAVGLTAMLMLTGCGNKIPDMTEAQAQQIGEYAAITLLKYDANSRSRLVDVSVIEEHDAKEQSLQELIAQQNKKPTSEGMKPVEDTPVVEIGKDAVDVTVIGLEDFYDLPEGVTINYQEREICDSYSGDASENAFVLDAKDGKKLLVMKFLVENQSGSNQRIDLFSKTAVYRVTMNGAESVNTLTTMLLDDMSTYVGTIAAGESKILVLLAEVDSDKADGITSLSLNLKNDAKTGTIQLQ